MWSWSFARIAGIELKIHATFLLVVVLGAVQWRAFGVDGALFGALLMLLTFGSVLLHELGHSLVALAFKIPVKDITLYPIGGVARLTARPRTPAQEFLVALAGPAVNVLLVVVLGALGAWWFGSEALLEAMANAYSQQPTLLTLTALLVSSNAALALFNMVPALPMDGGRVLRAVLSSVMGPARATRISAWIARVLAVGLLGVGVFFAPLLVITAIIVFIGAGDEVRQQQIAHVLDGIEAGDAINPYAPRLTPNTTLGEAMRVLTMTHWDAFAVEHSNRVVGVVTRKALLDAARREGAYGYVAGAMVRDVPSIRPNERLEAARQLMMEKNVSYVAVVRDGMFLGLLTDLDLALVADRLTANRRTWGEKSSDANNPARQ
ncbi:MAG: site-2 protease family protein [Archangium sp.]